jgi:hypothetical protein
MTGICRDDRARALLPQAADTPMFFVEWLDTLQGGAIRRWCVVDAQALPLPFFWRV